MIGREKEIKELEELYSNGRAEFIAIYGRRRVGKTYLVDELFKDRITFRHAGLSPVEISKGSKSPLKAQLEAFYYSLILQGMEKSKCPTSWLEAFFMLESYLQSIDHGERMVIFLDELPWMDTAKSGFITAFEGFWNGWACHRKNIMLIVCGSANSWILNELINNHGGLYGRVTHEIKLEPFTLNECEQFLNERHIPFSRYDIVQSYMIFGGIPYYLNYFRRDLSLAGNVDMLFFSKNAPFRIEFDRLFASIFKNAESAKEIVEFLSTKSIGYTRNEIAKKLKTSNSGALGDLLNSLIISDFVISYVSLGDGKRNEKYKLIDPFCLFYLRFVKNHEILNEDFFSNNVNSQSIVSWRGYSFENVCFNHIKQIKNALGISGVSTKQSAWSIHDESDEGTQIDLIIERRDNIVNMCEIKFYSDEFVVDKSYDLILRNRTSLLRNHIPKKCGIHNTIITTFGVKENEYKWDFQNILTIDDLFI